MSGVLGAESKLEDLARLKNAGAVTEAEFQLLRQGLMRPASPDLSRFSRRPVRERVWGRRLTICVGLLSAILIVVLYYPYAIATEMRQVVQERIDSTGIGYRVVSVALPPQAMLQETNTLQAQISTPRGIITVPLNVTGNIVFGDYDIHFTLNEPVAD